MSKCREVARPRGELVIRYKNPATSSGSVGVREHEAVFDVFQAMGPMPISIAKDGFPQEWVVVSVGGKKVEALARKLALVIDREKLEIELAPEVEPGEDVPEPCEEEVMAPCMLEPEALAAALNRKRWDEIMPVSNWLYELQKWMPHDWLVEALVAAFPKIRLWRGRKLVLFHLIRWAASHEKAYGLAVQALTDRSGVVVQEACTMLGRSERKDAIGHLEPLLDGPNEDVRDVAKWAISEINSGRK